MSCFETVVPVASAVIDSLVIKLSQCIYEDNLVKLTEWKRSGENGILELSLKEAATLPDGIMDYVADELEARIHHCLETNQLVRVTWEPKRASLFVSQFI